MGSLKNVISEISDARRLAADRGSWMRWTVDIVVYRLLRVWRPPTRGTRLRTITLANQTKLTYRRTRGDILTLREVWMDEVYRLPGDRAPHSVVDLGANIGLASVWFAKTYQCESIVAVEPLPDNVRLLRRNLRQNDIRATVLECAVGPTAGEARFAPSAEPNSGRLDGDGQLTVNVRSMDTVIGAPGRHVDVLKVDIEGGEEALFAGDLGWLSNVGTVIAELHPDLADTAGVVNALGRAGLRSGSGRVGDGAVTVFVRT